MKNMTLDFKKGNGLIPVIVQDDKTGTVLMLGYMNQEAYKKLGLPVLLTSGVGVGRKSG